MIKNNKGITLTSLTVTIIVLLILTGVGVNSIYTGINDFKDNRLEIELGLVRQVVVEQYQKAKSTNQLNIEIASNETVNFFVGDPVDINTVEFPEGKTPTELTTTTPKYLEERYYRLTPEKLETIGIRDTKNTYIVNYKTGEVYNETKKMNRQKELLYLPPVTYNIENTEDTTNFNDWDE